MSAIWGNNEHRKARQHRREDRYVAAHPPASGPATVRGVVVWRARATDRGLDEAGEIIGIKSKSAPEAFRSTRTQRPSVYQGRPSRRRPDSKYCSIKGTKNLWQRRSRYNCRVGKTVLQT